MTKTKAQLRAEAVERLNALGKYVHPSDIQWGLFGSGKDNMPPDKIRDELVSLLADDAHESRGSYEERLYDVPVSDCPYCGCERVVIHDYSDIYENPHSYRVEHVDEKEAFETGCFETYYAFDSAEKAVEHANMRDLLTDEPMDARRDSDGTCPDADGTASVAQDSREMLEAEIRHEYNGSIAYEADEIIGWLDRQAAITEREVREKNLASWQDWCDELGIPCIKDKAGEQFRAMQDRIDTLEAALKGERNNFYQATEARKHWQRKYETVMAERDRYREKLGRALDAAHEIARMVDES